VTGEEHEEEIESARRRVQTAHCRHAQRRSIKRHCRVHGDGRMHILPVYIFAWSQMSAHAWHHGCTLHAAAGKQAEKGGTYGTIPGREEFLYAVLARTYVEERCKGCGGVAPHGGDHWRHTTGTGTGTGTARACGRPVGEKASERASELGLALSPTATGTPTPRPS
jgi:hypothetical protein